MGAIGFALEALYGHVGPQPKSRGAARDLCLQTSC